MNNNDILESINDIDSTVMQSELSVLTSMMESYNKTLDILMNYDGDDISAFQEMKIVVVPDNTNDSSSSKKTIIGKIFDAIVRLFKFIKDKIAYFWNNIIKKSIKHVENVIADDTIKATVIIDKSEFDLFYKTLTNELSTKTPSLKKIADNVSDEKCIIDNYKSSIIDADRINDKLDKCLPNNTIDKLNDVKVLQKLMVDKKLESKPLRIIVTEFNDMCEKMTDVTLNDITVYGNIFTEFRDNYNKHILEFNSKTVLTDSILKMTRSFESNINIFTEDMFKFCNIIKKCLNVYDPIARHMGVNID